jgi:polar amino acid transport system permease protein
MAGTEASATGRYERFQLVCARVPFRAKNAIVWVVLFGLLFWFFSLAKFDAAWMLDNTRFVLAGLQYTLLLAVAAIVLACVLALLGALCRISSNPVLYSVAGFYTSFFRGTPLIVQLFLIYLALPQIAAGIGNPTLTSLATLSAFQAGVIGLGLNYGAYLTEIFRAGIQAVPHGQYEAAEALGMPYRTSMRRVILPQAFRIIIPPTGNEFIAMLKDTALVSFLGVAADQAEIFRRASLVGKSEYRNLEAYILAALIYWALTAVFTYFQGRLEKRVAKGYVRTSAAAAAAVAAAGQAAGTVVPSLPVPGTEDDDPGGGP